MAFRRHLTFAAKQQNKNIRWYDGQFLAARFRRVAMTRFIGEIINPLITFMICMLWASIILAAIAKVLMKKTEVHMLMFFLLYASGTVVGVISHYLTALWLKGAQPTILTDWWLSMYAASITTIGIGAKVISAKHRKAEDFSLIVAIACPAVGLALFLLVIRLLVL